MIVSGASAATLAASIIEVTPAALPAAQSRYGLATKVDYLSSTLRRTICEGWVDANQYMRIYLDTDNKFKLAVSWLGPQLVPNSDFETNVDGWPTPSGTTLTWDNGTARIDTLTPGVHAAGRNVVGLAGNTVYLEALCSAATTTEVFVGYNAGGGTPYLKIGNTVGTPNSIVYEADSGNVILRVDGDAQSGNFEYVRAFVINTTTIETAAITAPGIYALSALVTNALRSLQLDAQTPVTNSDAITLPTWTNFRIGNGQASATPLNGITTYGGWEGVA